MKAPEVSPELELLPLTIPVLVKMTDLKGDGILCGPEIVKGGEFEKKREFPGERKSEGDRSEGLALWDNAVVSDDEVLLDPVEVSGDVPGTPVEGKAPGRVKRLSRALAAPASICLIMLGLKLNRLLLLLSLLLLLPLPIILPVSCPL